MAFKSQILELKNKFLSEWRTSNLDRRGNPDYDINDFKYCSQKISELLVDRILGDFLSTEDIYLQERIFIENTYKTMIPSNIILSIIFSNYFNCEREIEEFEELAREKNRLSVSFEEKISELLQITEPLNSIASEKSPKYKKQSLIAMNFIDTEFNEFNHIKSIHSALQHFKACIREGILVRNGKTIRYKIQRYCLPPINYLINILDDGIKDLIANMSDRICHINSMIEGIDYTEDGLLYLCDPNSIKTDHLGYLHRMRTFIVHNAATPLCQFYEYKNIVQRTNLPVYKNFLSKHILEIDILEYWETYFGDIEFFQIAMILVAKKIYYDNLCKKYRFTPHADGGITFAFESLKDENFDILSDIPLCEFMFY